MDKEEQTELIDQKNSEKKIIQRRLDKLNPIHILRDNWGEYCFNETRMIDWPWKQKRSEM